MTEQSFEDRPCACCNNQLADDEPQTCRACVGRVRTDLHAIANSYALLPVLMAESALTSNAPRRDQARSNESPLPGGPLLVFLAGGSDAANRRRAYLRGVDDHWDEDDHPSDPCSVAHELGRHEDDWRRVQHQPAATHPYLVSPALAFLHLHLQWAANKHPGFADFAEDVQNLRWALERADGTANIPDKADAPCIDCGDDLVRRFREPDRTVREDASPQDREGEQHWGREPDWSCKGCRRTYTQDEYNMACLDQAEAEGGPWTPAKQAALDIGRPYRTLQTWCRRRLLSHRTHKGVLEVRINHARRLAAARPSSKAG